MEECLASNIIFKNISDKINTTENSLKLKIQGFKVYHLTIIFLFVILSLTNTESYAKAIETPFVKEKGHFKDVILSSDAQNLYTLKSSSGLVTKWQLDPIRILETYKISKKTKKSFRLLDITDDESKLLIRFGSASEDLRTIYIWDFNNKKFIGKIETKYFITTFLLQNNTLITITSENRVQKWDLKTFMEIENLLLPEKYFKPSFLNTAIHLRVIDNKNKIVLLSSQSIAFFNAKNFELLNILFVPYCNYYLSTNNTLYYITHHFSSEMNSYTDNQLFKIDINKEKVKLVSNTWLKNNKHKLVKIKSGAAIRSNRILFKKNLFIKINHTIEFFKRINKKKIATLYSLNTDDWLVMDNNGYFNGSKNSMKYLFMKNVKGKITPISKINFKKFQKISKKNIYQ